MSTNFDLKTLNLSAGTYEITAKARSNGYEDSEPSNTVHYVVVPQEDPEAHFDMVIDNIWIGGDIFAGAEESPIFESYEPSVEIDENGNTVFVYETLEFRMVVTGITDPSEITSPLYLKAGQKITIYPYNSYGYGRPTEETAYWEYKIVIPRGLQEATNGVITATIYNESTKKYEERMIWSAGFICWKYPTITIKLTYDIETGLGTIDARDRDGSGNTRNNVDFSYGVTIEVL